VVSSFSQLVIFKVSVEPYLDFANPDLPINFNSSLAGNVASLSGLFSIRTTENCSNNYESGLPCFKSILESARQPL